MNERKLKFETTTKACILTQGIIFKHPNQQQHPLKRKLFKIFLKIQTWNYLIHLFAVYFKLKFRNLAKRKI